MLAYVTDPGAEDTAALGRLVEQSFRLPPAMWPSIVERLPGGHRVVRRDGRVAAGLARYAMGHWFGGKSVPTWGLAAVCVDPAVRGRGVGRHLMVECLRESREAGAPISTLFPSTTAFYRSVGFERAGSRIEHVLDARRIERIAPPPLEVWPADLDTLREVAHRAGQRSAGVIDRCDAMWKRLLDPRGGDAIWAYACGANGRAEGTLVFQQGASPAFGYDVIVRELWGLRLEALATWWSFLRDMRSMARDIRWHGPASDPRTFPLPDQAWSIARTWQWMLRIVDVAGAVAARGWPVDGIASFEVSDALIAENSGRWRVVVEGGVGRAERGGDGSIAIDVRGLASLYSGFLSASALSEVGLAAGPPGDLAAASALFAGPEPWFQDMF